MIHIGIDPGASGCIAAISETGVRTLRFQKATDKDIYEFMSDLSLSGTCFCTKEKVWAMPSTDGDSRKMGASTSFTFGENNGFIRGILVATMIPYEEKTPQTWQKLFGMKKEKNEAQPDYKRRLKQKAEELFPDLKITADMADALLIAEFTKRTHNVKF